MRFGPELVMHIIVAFFGAKFPRLIENSRASSLATILVTVVVVRILLFTGSATFLTIVEHSRAEVTLHAAS